jgi:glucose/arabinose dehydrogenase
MVFLPGKQMIFDERPGAFHLLQDGKIYNIGTVADIFASGEGGLLGLTIDSNFAANHYLYACFDHAKASGQVQDVRVARWKLSDDLMHMTDRVDIVTGMPAISSGRHSGCRLAFGPDGYLWVGTGDAATGGNSQSHTNLGGKILRVDRDGKAVPGNLGGDFDPRIYSYGHRNVQGLAFFPQAQNGVLGINVEHGSTVDDEVNLLRAGNFGWNPPANQPYTEIGVAMTDTKTIPDVIPAIWSSGAPTQAPSGATFLTGSQWKSWEGALAISVLKDQKLKILTINANNKVTAETNVFTKLFGRLRTAAQGPDGNLYLSTDNGKVDQIIRVTPH